MPQIAPSGRTAHASNLTMQAPHAAQRPTLSVPTVTASQDVKDATPRRLLAHKRWDAPCERCAVAEPTALTAYFRRALQELPKVLREWYALVVSIERGRARGCWRRECAANALALRSVGSCRVLLGRLKRHRERVMRRKSVGFFASVGQSMHWGRMPPWRTVFRASAVVCAS